MVLVLIAAVVVAVVAVVVFLRLRPRGGDLDSVRSYHSALGTLEHLSERTGGSTVRVVGSSDPESGPRVYPPTEARVYPPPEARIYPPAEGKVAGTSAVPPVPVRDNDDFPGPGTPLVFDDARPSDRPQVQPAHEGAGPLRVDRAQRHALDSMNRRPRRATAVVIAVVVLVVFGVLAYSGSKRSRSSGHATSSSSTPTTGATSTTAASTSSTASHGAAGGGHTKKKKVATTTTTAPSQIVATATTGSTATYPVGPQSYRLSVTATAPCWVQATTVSTGATLWAGTLQAGGTQVIHASGVVTLNLGAPSVSLTVNQVPVVFPTPMHTPFVATFQPTAASTATTTTTTVTAPATSTP